METIDGRKTARGRISRLASRYPLLVLGLTSIVFFGFPTTVLSILDAGPWTYYFTSLILSVLAMAGITHGYWREIMRQKGILVSFSLVLLVLMPAVMVILDAYGIHTRDEEWFWYFSAFMLCLMALAVIDFAVRMDWEDRLERARRGDGDDGPAGPNPRSD